MGVSSTAAASHPGIYYHLVRSEIAGLVPPGTRRLLSVGCGSGQTERFLKERYGIAEVVGIEREESVVGDLQANVDRMIRADVEHAPFPFPAGYFDCILTLDVLEHLVHPEVVLRECRRVLAPDGLLIASIPNARHYEMILRLLAGDWQPRPAGILDYTHLHFYTDRTIRALFAGAGFRVERWRRKYQAVLYPATARLPRLLQKGLVRLARPGAFFALWDRVPLGREWWTFQYVLVARKS